MTTALARVNGLSDGASTYLFEDNIPSFSDAGNNLAKYKKGVFSHFTRTYTNITLQSKFDQLASKWEIDTISMSNMEMICSNKSYLEIIGMGEKVLPYIFNRLYKKPDHWFWALSSITGLDPIPQQFKGDVYATTLLWLDWGLKNGYFHP